MPYREVNQCFVHCIRYLFLVQPNVQVEDIHNAGPDTKENKHERNQKELVVHIFECIPETIMTDMFPGEIKLGRKVA